MVVRIVRRLLTAALAGCLVLGFAIDGARAQAVTIAVVVNPANLERGMSSAELCDILLGERQRWPNGRRIQALVPPAGSPEWTVVLRAVCRLSEAGFSRQVGSRRAFGRSVRPPQAVADASELRRRVAASVDAIGLVAAPQLDGTVKVLSIDGRLPTDAEYSIARK
jgi:hypothetical protein